MGKSVWAPTPVAQHSVIQDTVPLAVVCLSFARDDISGHQCHFLTAAVFSDLLLSKLCWDGDGGGETGMTS